MLPSLHAPASRRVLLASLVLALFVGCSYWPVRAGGRLADELVLAGYVLEPGPDGLVLSWRRVVDDLVGPWAFGGGDYYRPLVTATLVFDQWLGGGDAGVLHVTSIVLFALAVVAVVHWLATLFGVLPAFAGGLFLAAHPAAHEPICWPCTRADFLVLAAGAWACSAFVAHLREGRRRDFVWAHVAAVVAFLSKENAVLLPACFVLLDCGLRPRSVPWRERVRANLGIAALTLAYLVWRWCVLGRMFAPTAPGGGDWQVLGEFVTKLAVAVMPSGDRLPPSARWTMLAVVVWAIGGCLLQRAGRKWLGIGIAWTLLAMLPVLSLPVTENLERGRYLLGSLVGIALVLAAGAAHHRRQGRIVGAVLLGLAVVDMTLGARAMQATYVRAWRRIDELRAQLAPLAAAATDERPLVLLSGLPVDRGIPFLPAIQVHALVTPPLAATTTPFVSLGLSLEPGVGADLLEADVLPWRAMWQHGAQLAYLLPDGPRFVLCVPGPQPAAFVRLTAGPAGFEVQGAPASPWPIGGVEVVADAPFERGELVWRSAMGPGRAIGFTAGTATPTGWSASVDLMQDGDFLVLGTLAGITGFGVQLVGATPVRLRDLRLLPIPEPVPLPAPLRGARLSLDEAMARLPWQVVPATAEPGTTAVVMMNRAFAWRLPRSAGDRAQLPPLGRSYLRDFDAVARQDRVYYFLQWRAAGRAWRSQVDWFERTLD